MSTLTHGTPRAWHTEGILGLVVVPPFSSVTTVRLLTRAVAITNGSAPLRFFGVWLFQDDLPGRV
jgi:hypothetical protein